MAAHRLSHRAALCGGVQRHWCPRHGVGVTSNNVWLQFDLRLPRSEAPPPSGPSCRALTPRSTRTTCSTATPVARCGRSPASRAVTGSRSTSRRALPASPPSPQSPMPVIDPPTGQLCVTAALSNPAGHVAEFCRQSTGTWLQFDLTASYGGPAAAGDIEPLVDPQLNETVFFFRDASGNLSVARSRRRRPLDAGADALRRAPRPRSSATRSRSSIRRATLRS